MLEGQKRGIEMREQPGEGDCGRLFGLIGGMATDRTGRKSASESCELISDMADTV